MYCVGPPYSRFVNHTIDPTTLFPGSTLISFRLVPGTFTHWVLTDLFSDILGLILPHFVTFAVFLSDIFAGLAHTSWLCLWPYLQHAHVPKTNLQSHVIFTANGKAVDATQELLAIGAANLANSFVQAFPVTGGLSRSAVNNSSGVKSPLGGLYTGLLVIVALLFFTQYFFYIPKSALAAVIIAAVVFMVEIRVVKPMWRTKSKFLLIISYRLLFK